jgi:hypothetical protein
MEVIQKNAGRKAHISGSKTGLEPPSFRNEECRKVKTHKGLSMVRIGIVSVGFMGMKAY